MMQRTILATLALAASVTAQLSVVIPNGTATTEGNSSNAFPWGRGGTGLIQQCLYSSNHFVNQGITFPILITGLRWRPNTNVALTASGYGQAAVNMSTSPTGWATPSTTMAANHGPDLATVFSGPVNWAAQAAVVGPTPFGIVVPLTTNFLYDPTQGDLNIEVDLPIQTTAPTSFQIDVQTTGGDGARVYVSTGYPGTGTGTITTNHAIVVQVDYVPASGLYAGFGADVTSGPSPLTVNFTDTSFSSDPGGVLGWAWDFDGDSIIDSTLQNPTHTYTNCGSYSVSLTVVDAVHGSNTTTRTNYIVTDEVTASFTYAPIAPGVYQFTDTSTPAPTSWAWDLDGDNVVDDTTQNPVFFYSSPCTAVNVTLTASRLCGPASSHTESLVISPNTLTAQTTGGNGLSSTTSIGMVFDAEVLNPLGAAICAVSVRPYTFVGPFNLSLYISEGSYLDMVGGVARHTNIGLWRLIGTGTGTSVGGTTTTSVSALVPLGATAYVPAGKYCFAVMISNPAGTANMAYTTGTAANSGPFADANMVISPNPTAAPGAVKTTLFGTTMTASRVWNGAFHYATHGDDGKANFGFAGLGCAGSLGVPQLSSTSTPTLGSSFQVSANNLANSVMVLATGFGRQSPSPLDLTPFGAPGCKLDVAIAASSFHAGAGNQATWTLTVPVSPAFSGMVLFNQAVALDPAANTLGAVMSDASGLVIGN